MPDIAGARHGRSGGLLREEAMPTWREGASPKGTALGARATPLLAFGCSFWREQRRKNMLLLQRALSLQVRKNGVTEACLREKVKQ